MKRMGILIKEGLNKLRFSHMIEYYTGAKNKWSLHISMYKYINQSIGPLAQF